MFKNFNLQIFSILLWIYVLNVIAIDFNDVGEQNAIVGRNTTLTCQATELMVWWSKNGQNITKTDKKYSWNSTENEQFENENDPVSNSKTTYSHTLTILNGTMKDTGNYTCHFPESENKNITETSFFVQSVLLPKIVQASDEKIERNEKESKDVTLFCVVEAYPMDLFNKSIKWEKETVDTGENKDSTDASEINADIMNRTKVEYINDSQTKVSIKFDKVGKKYNGTYTCLVNQPSALEENIGIVEKKSSILILSPALADISFVKAIGKTRIFMNWTVTDDGNSPIKMFLIQYKLENETTYTYTRDKIDGNQTSVVVEKLIPNSRYQFKLSAVNFVAPGPVTDWLTPVQTLKEDPVFVPIVEVKGNSFSTITIGWQPPPPEMLDYIHYYVVMAFQSELNKTVEEAIHPQNSRNLPYMVNDLQTATEYLFKVRACSEFTKECGNWSAVVNGTTMDGLASVPLDVKIQCLHFNFSRRSSVTVDFKEPANPNGIIISYQIILNGVAQFKNEHGNYINQTFGPKAKNVDRTVTKASYDNVPANTNYTITVAAVTRSKKPGDLAVVTCTMPTTVPDTINKMLWGKYQTENNDWIFKFYLPRLSERNGPICCYRIYMIRMGSSSMEKSPDEIDIGTYEEAHQANNTIGGAYIAEIIPSSKYQPDVFLGDGKRTKFNKLNFDGRNGRCNGCLTNILKKTIREVRPTKTTPASIMIDDSKFDDDEPVSPGDAAKINADRKKRRRRRRNPELELPSPPTDLSILDSVSLNLAKNKSSDFVELFDGGLDINSNYSGFLEVIVENDENSNQVVSIYSDYFPSMSPKAPPKTEQEELANNQMFNAITYLLAGLIILVMSMFFLLCLLHRYQKKHVIQGNEIVSLTDSLRLLCHGRANHHPHRSLASVSKPPDLPPIIREGLPQAYIDRHKDSDYGFQHEFELLPDRFSDRTSRSGDLKENVFKNRYPDIKSYDQTRVKLSTLNSVVGSDYINANFVIGYKERKKFICAQGPMDSTVNDFWRMIWEQHLEIIVMLTNLEEYNKTKCAKYWPERVNDSVQYGDMTVSFENEQRYSDYLIRNMKIAKRSQNEDDEMVEEPARNITQYHYLVWKDFMAPEHPYGILKFIKTINADYSVQRGPLLIHCSAGVGRTGTLVALDSLIQQLNDENQVSIFNTICDMRHQRNYLVQSLKQYIFLYRALLDVGQYGDTELKFKGLSAAVEQLKQRANDSKEQCKLEREYEKIKAHQDDIKKTCTVGGSEENAQKNRSEEVIPYDRNRVILTPIPGRENSTYINASFVEGYDNQESFIISQDPLEHTCGDFWRMISEQSITTLVMMTEIGDSKCPRYWADDEIQYDHILVKYIQSESCPYYTKREFQVTNCKINDTINVTHFQYNGWPTVDGEVPEVTRGMLEIVHQAQTHHQQKEDDENQMKPIAVHCCKGTDRSSIFVAMSILVQQLRLEKKVDICTLVRKLRAQRLGIIDSYAQYEFLHRAIVNYADLHKQSLESPSNHC